MSAKRKPDGSTKATSAARTRAYRERMRAKGLRPVTIWTYDINDPVFRKRLEEDCRRIRASAQEKEIMAELEGFEADFDPWD